MKIIITILISLGSHIIFAQEFSKLKKLPININYEKDCENEDRKIIRENQNVVSLSFIQNISDSIIIYVNDMEVKRGFAKHDPHLVSTDFTDFSFAKEYLADSNSIKIVYLNSASYIEFNLDKSFPLYCIYFYKEGYYTVSGRKCIVIIR